MNLLKKQGFYNSITLYTGTALGFFNLIILFQRVLTAEEIGFFGLISSVSLLYAQLAGVGFSSAITRYFPFFRSDDRIHEGFPSYVFKVTAIGFVTVSFFFIVGKPLVQHWQENNNGSSLFYQYYYLIIPVALFSLWYNLSETFARTTFHNIYPAFLREVLLKVLTSLSVLLIFYKAINYQTFVYFYIAANGIILLLLLIYLKKLDLIRFKSVGEEVRKKSPEILRYGIYSMLAGGSFAFIQNIDTIMLKLLSSEAMVGYYVTFFGMALVINLPAKALNTTSYQIVADAWKENDLKKIQKIYHKTSLVQFFIGCLLLIGLIANWQNVLFLLHKPEYADYYGVFVVVGLGFLFDITGGLNSAIISFSKDYKIIMYILVVAALFCTVSNIILIPKVGMMGAAISYSLTMLLLNFTYWVFLFKKHGLQPFNLQFIKLMVLAVIVLAIGYYIPYVKNFFFDVVIRSGIMALLYVGISYVLKISLDINEFVDQILKKLKIN